LILVDEGDLICEPCFAPIDRAGMIPGRSFLQSMDVSNERLIFLDSNWM
jgi:hypothetical protein